MERTFAIIKPDAVAAGQSGEIIAMIQNAGFRIAGMKSGFYPPVVCPWRPSWRRRCSGRGGGRNPQTGHPVGSKQPAKYRDSGRIHADSRDHRLNFSRIGFGTYPVKCDTCSAARGPGEQDFPVAQPDLGPIPDGRRRQDCRNRCQEFETALNVALARRRRFAIMDGARRAPEERIGTTEWPITTRLAIRS